MAENLPVGWRLARFDEIMQRVERKFLLDDAHEYDCVGVRWYGLGAFVRERQLGMNIQRKQQWILKQGDVVYNKLFAWKGSFAIADGSVDNCIVSDKFPTYQINPKLVDSKFLKFYFRTPQLAFQATTLSKGAAAISKLTLNPPQFWDLEIPLPPLDEQRRIVAHIEALGDRIAEARGLRAGALEEAEAILVSEARHIFEQLNIEPLPLSEWVDQAREGIQTGPFGAQLGSSDFQDSGRPLLTIGNIQYSGLKLDNLKFISEEKAQQLERYTVREGDILFARMGTVGRCCVIPRMAENWVFNYHIIRVAPDWKRVEPRYLHWIIQASSDVEAYLEANIRGATREGVNTKIVGGLPCRVPLPEEQIRIIDYLDELQSHIQTLKHLQTETAAELDALLPSLLDQAFRGEL